MTTLARCPDCERLHALPPRPGVDGTLWLVVCGHCGELWAPGPLRDREPDTSTFCAAHPERRATRVCEACGAGLCDPCSVDRRAPGERTRLSPCCRASCLPIAELRSVRPFWRELRRVLMFALRGEGPIVIAVLWLAGFVPVLSWFQPAFVLAWATHVLRASGRDPEVPPTFPDIEEAVTGLVLPLFRVAIVTFVAIAPWLLYRQYGPAERFAFVDALLLAPGLAALPAMLLLTASGEGLPGAIDPRSIVTTVRSMGRDYGALMLVAVAEAVVWMLTRALVARVDAASLIVGPLRIYTVITAFHLGGRAILQTRDRIDWQL